MSHGPEDKTFVKYVIYSHYAKHEKEDFESWRPVEENDPTAARKLISELPGISFLVRKIPYISQILHQPGQGGMLVLFYGIGLVECIHGMGRKSAAEMRQLEKIRFAEEVKAHISECLSRAGDGHRIRFVTAMDLFEIFDRVSVLRGRWAWWLIGKNQTYDSPKIVESIIHLRLLGTGVPVFRMDWDVLLEYENPDEIKVAIASCLSAYKLRMEDPTVSTFLFSASYHSDKILPATTPKEKFDAWSEAFATRIFPSLRVKNHGRLNFNNGGNWTTCARNAFDETLARKFYGIADNSLSCDCSSGISFVGANPAVSVISGSMLCLSDTAVLDLPPFSNFRLNVVWIDDHLKYALYRELKQLTSVDLKLVDPALSRAKIDGVMLRKVRGEIKDLPAYVLKDYLPRLLWGCVMDEWISGPPLLKRRFDDLITKADKEEWIRLIKQGSGAPFPKALQRALETQDFEARDQDELTGDLTELALKRIELVRQEWGALKAERSPTFASIWAQGPAAVLECFPRLENEPLALGIPNKPNTEIHKVEDLNPALGRQFEWLLEDAARYISYSLAWPGLVRMVRSIRQGSICTDMSWKPTN